MPFEELHQLEKGRPELDTSLRQGDLIVAIELPAFSGRSHYLKVRDRASYAFALVSCAVALDLTDGRISAGRIALGGVAHKPWRVREAERLLAESPPSRELFLEVADLALRGSRVHSMNGYKVSLAQTLVERTLSEAAGLKPLNGPAGTAFASSVGEVAGVDAPR